MKESKKEEVMPARYTLNRYIVKYWSAYRMNWVTVMVDAPTEAAIADAIGRTDFEVVRDCGRII